MDYAKYFRGGSRINLEKAGDMGRADCHRGHRRHRDPGYQYVLRHRLGVF